MDAQENQSAQKLNQEAIKSKIGWLPSLCMLSALHHTGFCLSSLPGF